MKRRRMLLLLLAALSAVAGCTREPTIKIVSSLPRTGSAKGQTDTIVNGIKMAIEEAGGKDGYNVVTLPGRANELHIEFGTGDAKVDYKIEYLDWDDSTAAAGAYTAEMEENNAKKAVADQDVVAYIGPFNSPAAAISMPILNEADLLMISPANTRPGLTKPGTGNPDEPAKYQPTGRKNYTRVVPADDLQGKVAAEWAKDMGVESVFILDDGDVYGRGIAQIFNDTCNELMIEVLGHESIDPKQQEFRSLMTTIKAKNPDLIYFGGTTQSKGGQIAKDLVASGMEAKLMVPDGCFEDAFIEAATAENLNDRCFLTFGGVPPEKQEGPGKEFVEKYQEKYGAMPEPYAIYGYEAAKVALKAIADAGQKDRRAITDAAFAIRDFEGALGTWSFDENGDTDLTIMSGSTVKDGKFEFVKILGE